MAIVVSQNAAGNPGSGMQIDVSGDSNMGIARAGQQPIHAALIPRGNRAFVANTDGTVTAFSPASFFGPIGTPVTVSLPSGLTPQFLYSTESGTMYALATNDGTFAQCAASAVVAIDLISSVVTKTACVGPDAGLQKRVLTETPDGRKIYVVNGDGTVSSINTVDFSTNPPVSPAALNPALTTPVSLVASLDNSRVFVLDASGLIWTITTFNDQPTAVTTNAATGGANFIFLEASRNRLYTTSSTSNTVAIFDAAATVPQTVAVPLTLPPGSTPVMITALPDGSRVYVLSSTATGAFVTAIDALSERITATIALPGATANPNAVPICQAARYPLSMAAAGDSHRLYVADCVAGSTNIIDTIKNSLVLSLKSPTSAYSPVGNSKYPPPQNPVWVVAGP